MADMPRRRPIGVHREKSRHGKLCWYYRENRGPRVRLPDMYGTPEFWDAYKRAVAGDKQPMDRVTTSKGAWAWMVMQYLESRAFLSYSDSTQKQRRKLLRDAAKKAGKKTPSAVTEASIRRVMVERPPHAANNFLKALRGFYAWAWQMGYIDRAHDPTRQIPRNRTKSSGWDVWSDDQLAAYRAHWSADTMERKAFELLLGTGLRRSDVIRLGRFHDKGDMIEIEAKKNGITCYIAITADLRRWMASEAGLYLRHPNGSPFTNATFGAWFAEACKVAGIPDGVRAHSLRKTAATKDAEAGMTAHQLMAKFGWAKLEEAERYTRKADRRRLAQQGAGAVKNSAILSIGANETGTE